MAINIFAMPSSSILLLLSIAFSRSNAFPSPLPEKTVAYKADEWSPRPTNIPPDPAKLFKRNSVDTNVCGWIGGNSADAAVCPSGSSCIHDTIHGYVGCCTTSGPCTAGVYSSCVDYHSSGWNSNPTWENNGVYTCPGSMECYQNTYPGGYLQWACGASSDATSIETTFSGQPSDFLLQVVFTGVNFGPMSAAPTTTSSTSTSTSSSSSAASTTSGGTSSSSSATSSATGGAKNKSEVSGGVIAAAVILPLVFISVIIGVIYFFWRRRQNEKIARRPSSFTGAFKSVSPESSQEEFTQAPPTQAPPAQAPVPDDFVSPMSERANKSSPPLNPYVFSPASEYRGIQERMNASADNPYAGNPYMDDSHADNPYANPYAMPEESFSSQPNNNVRNSELENFSGAYMAAVGEMSPPTPPQAAQTGNRRVAPMGPGHLRDSELGMGMGVGVNPTRRRDNSDVWPEDQATEPFPLYEARGFRSENVRMEGWTPRELRPTKRAPNSPQRYELVDEPPQDGVQVLHTPGQLRGKKAMGGMF